MSNCEHCGGDKVFKYSHGCPGCGAPVCCQTCCDDENTQRAAPAAPAASDELIELLTAARRNGSPRELALALARLKPSQVDRIICALAAPSQPADQNECSLCNGMGFIDGIGTTCPHCVGEGSEPVAQAMGAPEEWAEFQQWRRMKKIFANRPPSPASADFDFPGPNDRDEPVAQAAQQPDGYGDTEFGYTFAGIQLEEGDKRLATMIVRALGNDHPAMNDLVSLLFRARPASRPAAEQAAAEQAAAEAEILSVAGRIAQAVAEDEDGEGCDISAGLFGPKFSAIVRELVVARRPVRELTDAEIEAAALEHVAPLWGKIGPGGDYKLTEQFKRLREFARALLAKATGEGK